VKVKPFRTKKTSLASGFVACGLIGTFVTGLLMGCGAILKDHVPSPNQPPAVTPAPETVSAIPEPTADGMVVARSPASTTDPNSQISDSLWRSNSALGSLFISQKAHHVGDIVTIRIVESSSASNKANTTTERDSSINIQTPQFFGAEDEVPSSWLFNPLGNLSAGFGSDFEGDGETNRSGDLTAYITSKITEVLPNGNLRILGVREVTVNNEKQFIHISGVIRSRDISTDNIILSTYIADAKIEYSGKGIIDDRQKPGWLANLFNALWPF
jgi:flagellar L-ring protein precursor FlgH